MLCVLHPGTRAGEMRKAKETILQYRHLSEEQKAKLLHALEAKAHREGGGADGAGGAQITDALRTEVGRCMGWVAAWRAPLIVRWWRS